MAKKRRSGKKLDVVAMATLAVSGGIGYFAAKKAGEYAAGYMKSDPAMGATFGAVGAAAAIMLVGPRFAKGNQMAVIAAAGAACVPAIYAASRQFNLTAVADNFMLAGEPPLVTYYLPPQNARALQGDFSEPLSGDFASPLAGSGDMNPYAGAYGF